MKTLKEIFEKANRPLSTDCRNYYHKQIEKLLDDGSLVLWIAPRGRFYVNKANNFLFNFRVVINNKIAQNYRCTGEIDAEEIFFAIAKLIKKNKLNLAADFNTAEHCHKCSGTGIIPAFKHIADGVCFDCFGTGFSKYR